MLARERGRSASSRSSINSRVARTRWGKCRWAKSIGSWGPRQLLHLEQAGTTPRPPPSTSRNKMITCRLKGPGDPLRRPNDYGFFAPPTDCHFRAHLCNASTARATLVICGLVILLSLFLTPSSFAASDDRCGIDHSGRIDRQQVRTSLARFEALYGRLGMLVCPSIQPRDRKWSSAFPVTLLHGEIPKDPHRQRRRTFASVPPHAL
jgi:hypothetical protein